MAQTRIIVLALIVPLLISLTACSKSPAEKALKELKQKNIAYTEDSFMEHVKKGDKAVVDSFLTAGMSPNLRKIGSIEEPILNIAAAYGHTEMVNLLVAKGADFNAKDNEGWTALMEAARLGNTDVVKILVDKGADVNTMNNTNQTALMIAKKRTWHDIVNILEKAGATTPKEAIEGLLTEADSQWQKGDYQNALQNYQEILSLDPNNSKAKEFLKKYSAVELTIDDIKNRFEKSQGLNEFEQKKRSEEQKEFLSKKETYFSTLNNDLEFAISEYDFKRKRFNVTVGLRQGKVIGPAFEGYSGMISDDIFLIVNEDGRHLVFPLNIDEEKAASLKSQDKKEQKVLVIYKLKKVERFTDALGTTPSRANPRGGAILVDRFRRYIKPLYVALLTGNEKYVLYEAKGSEIKSESITKIKPVEKRRRRK